MNFRFFTSLSALVVTVVAIYGDDGASAYDFLDVTPSSHVYGLGGVNISLVDDDVELIEQNPALLGPEMSRQLGISYMRYIGSSNFADARFAMAAGERSACAVALRYFGYGQMTSTDATGVVNGTFSPKDLYLSGSFSHDITDRLRGGISLKAVYSHYDEYTAFAIATDLGLNYFDPDNDVSLSLVVANLGGQIKRFTDVYNRLPVDVRIGWTQGFGEIPLRISVTAWNLTKWHLPYIDPGDGASSSVDRVKDSFASNLFRHLVFGIEFVPSERIYVGLGYNYKTRTDMASYSRDILSGFSMCAGLNVSRFRIGAAVSRPHTGAATFVFNLAMNL